MAQRQVKCGYCGLTDNKEVMTKEGTRYYHNSCYDIVRSKKDLYAYICKVLGLESPGPRIYKQLSGFFSQYPHYTYVGIKQALVYFYEVQGGDKSKAHGGIGIVPYVYDEAQEYYNNIARRQQRVATEISGSLESAPAPLKIKVQETKKKEKLTYNLEDFL